MDRRTLLQKGGLVLGAGLMGCAPRLGSVQGLRPGRRLVPVQASWERVIRTTVGLRPYRPAGFVLRADRLDAKLLVQNYGHGGSGMSLSWGTAQIAAELALQRPERRAAVIGCGVVGLTTTRQLQRRGFDVTIYAMSIPPNTTSNMSIAGWTPTSGIVSTAMRTTEWDAQLREAARIAYTQLQLPALRMEPSIYLDALVRDVREAGATIMIRRFDSPRDLAALEEDVIVNCSGLGSGELVGDREIRPVKGQLTHLMPQREVAYSTFGGGPSAPGGFTQMQPRSDGIALGGTSLEGDWSLEPNEEHRRRVVEAHIALFAGMRG